MCVFPPCPLPHPLPYSYSVFVCVRVCVCDVRGVVFPPRSFLFSLVGGDGMWDGWVGGFCARPSAAPPPSPPRPLLPRISLRERKMREHSSLPLLMARGCLLDWRACARLRVRVRVDRAALSCVVVVSSRRVCVNTRLVSSVPFTSN